MDEKTNIEFENGQLKNKILKLEQKINGIYTLLDSRERELEITKNEEKRLNNENVSLNTQVRKLKQAIKNIAEFI